MKVNCKISYISTPEIRAFEKQYLYLVRFVARILGRKIREGKIIHIHAGSGYMVLADGGVMKPTAARDDPDWFKHVFEGVPNKSLSAVIIEWVANRYQGFKRRNRKYSPYVEIKKSVLNIKKNMMKYEDGVIYCNDFNNVKLPYVINKSSGFLGNFSLFEEQKTGPFAANILFDKNLVIPTVEKPDPIKNKAEGFFSFDINKTDKYWLTSNYAIFNGSKYIEKPTSVKVLEQRVKKAQKWLNDSLKPSPKDRGAISAPLDIDQDSLPESLRGDLPFSSKMRRKVRLYWAKAHAALQKEVSGLSFWSEVVNFCEDNSLGYAHDNVTTGQKNGTFSQDKIRTTTELLFRSTKVPYVSVPTPNTSNTCPECALSNKKNRIGDDFRCIRCEFAGVSHEIAAINIANKAFEIFQD